MFLCVQRIRSGDVVSDARYGVSIRCERSHPANTYSLFLLGERDPTSDCKYIIVLVSVFVCVSAA